MSEEIKVYKRIRRKIQPGRFATYWLPNSYEILPEEEIVETAEIVSIGTKTKEGKPLPKYEAYADK